MSVKVEEIARVDAIWKSIVSNANTNANTPNVIAILATRLMFSRF